jgi:DNA-binding XRE family transcriptional regulator
VQGHDLKALRERLTVKQDALAAELGTTANCIRIIEERKSEISVPMLARYATAVFLLAKRDITKRQALAQELTTLGERVQRAGQLLR